MQPGLHRTHSNMSTERDFEQCFGPVRSRLEAIWERVEGLRSLYRETTLELFTDLNNSFARLLPEYRPCNNLDFVTYCVPHIDSFLLCLYRDPDWQACDPHDQNLLLWVCILHDLKKRIDYSGAKDPRHPFNSAAGTIRYFERWGWVGGPVEEVAVGLENAKRTIYGDYEVQDNSVLQTVLPAVLSLCRVPCSTFTTYKAAVATLEAQDKPQLFALEIFILVMLHQSLDLLRDHPSLSPLLAAQIPVYFSKRLLGLMRIVARCDSLSYDFKNLPRNAELHRQAINEKIDRYAQLLDSDL